jgi:Acetylornithine deacetylase/Succinyl-diaminopimelate desuccinylase and related deacylases
LAVDALTQAEKFPAVTVKLLIEGGEESGSAGLREYLTGEAPHVADADLVYVADGPRHAVATGVGHREGRPTVAYGNRGIIFVEIRHQTANTDLHSGNFGGPVPAATNELVGALSSMRDGDEIVIDGFHDGSTITDADRKMAASIPDDGDAIAEELDLTQLTTDDPFYSALLLEPALTINSLTGGFQGEGLQTVLPHSATATLDFRLVPGQDPPTVFQAIRDHLESVNPNLEVTNEGTFPPMKTPADSPAATPIRRALKETWETEIIELPALGGSLPAAYFRNVDTLSTVPVFVVPYANHDQQNHSPNEHLTLECFEKGIQTSAAVIQNVAENSPL